MINLRYHIVSITAVFLALGIGTALGGTFLDRYTVDVLDRNISSAEARIRETESQNARLEAEIGKANARDEALVQTGAASLFAEELTDVPVLLVVSQGVDADVVSELRAALTRADAQVRGTVELRNALEMRGEVDRRIADAVEQDPKDPDAVRSAMFTRLREAFAAAGEPVTKAGGGAAEPPVSTSVLPPAPEPTAPAPTDPPTTEAPDDTTPAVTTTIPATGGREDGFPDGTQPAIITTLLSRDLIRFTAGPGQNPDQPILEKRGYRYVFVGGSGLDPAAPRLMLSLLPTPARRALPAVVVSATPPQNKDTGADDVPSIVAQIRASSDRAGVYSTVDDVDVFTGLTSTVLTVRDLGRVEVAHYGQGPGASAIVPGPS